ncbi:hypothetical protein L21SP2_0135 [Salinispira pacifica]|uniref:Uncharacterized protein n=1 Tax=Salinispira pacifica TaxID=1307761 RepID=V5WDF2_9SPIO|nr:hypothetical protein L21SP2_0135 [Salinispira pacifica]
MEQFSNMSIIHSRTCELSSHSSNPPYLRRVTKKPESLKISNSGRAGLNRRISPWGPGIL